MLEKLVKFGKCILAIIMAFATFYLVDLWTTIIFNEFVNYNDWAWDHQAFMLSIVVVGNVLLARYYYVKLTEKKKEN